jgi:S1-C subfamily serine protease
MLHALFRGLSPRTFRTFALVLAQVVTLGLGAAGAIVWQNSTAPAPLAQTAVEQAQTDPACLPAAAGQLSVADIAEMANPAVVTITNLMAGEQQAVQSEAPAGEGEDALPVGTGSGFIIDASGIVVTNSHVVFGADELTVRFFNGTTVSGTVVGLDDPNLLDVAVVQLDLSDGTQVPGVLSLGDSDALRVGDQVIAIGSALGEFTNTVTSGMVNAVGRDLQGYGLNTLIQHDAEIWRGNSGGPLLNMQGQVVGVNSAGISSNQMSATSPAEMAFAISSNAVQSIVDEVLATGTVARPYLGIVGGQMESGHQVQSVEPGTPAADAGLQAGDVIVAINGEALDGETNLLDLLFVHKPGDTITLEVVRNGETLSIDLVLGTRPVLSQ